MTDFAGLDGITLRKSTIANLKNSALHRCHLCALLIQAFTHNEARVFIQEYQPFKDQRYGLKALPDSYGRCRSFSIFQHSFAEYGGEALVSKFSNRNIPSLAMPLFPANDPSTTVLSFLTSRTYGILMWSSSDSQDRSFCTHRPWRTRSSVTEIDRETLEDLADCPNLFGEAWPISEEQLVNGKEGTISRNADREVGPVLSPSDANNGAGFYSLGAE